MRRVAVKRVIKARVQPLLSYKKIVGISVGMLLISILGVTFLSTYRSHQDKIQKAYVKSKVGHLTLLPETETGLKREVIKEKQYKITTASSSRVDNQITLAKGQTQIGITTLASSSLGEVNSVSAEQQGEKTIYTNIYNGVNLIYTRSENRLLEEFEVRNPRIITEVVQKIDLTNATYQKQKDGSYLVFDKETGEFSFAIPRPVMYEKNDQRERSYGLHYELVEYNGHTFLLKIIDESGSEWMKKASYPIMIDATIDLTLSSFTSYPIINNTWSVRIDTVGEGDLIVAPSSGLSVTSFTCGGEKVSYQEKEGKLFSNDFSCGDEALLTFALSVDSKQEVTFTYSGLTTTVETPEYQGKPVVLSSTLSPSVVQVGDTITVSAEILDKEGIETVTADMGGVETISLSRKSGTDVHGEWEGKWVVHSTATKPYQTILKATNKAGNFTTSQIAFFDPYTCNGGGDHAGADWTPASDCPSGFAGTHTNIGTFNVANSTTASITAYDGSNYGTASISATTVSIIGTLSADGKGFRGGSPAADGEGPGKGIVGSNTQGRGSGGGYGGNGGTGSNGSGSGGYRYGSLTGPTDRGSGGSGGRGNNDQSGGAGGGGLFLEATGTLTVSGTITANGANGGAGYCNGYPAGGGSGGSILLRAGTVTGGGTIRSNGGTGGTGCGNAGAGGGGRIAAYYFTSNTFSGSVSVAAGSAGNSGESGTSFIEGLSDKNLIIPGTNGQWNGGERTSWSFKDLTINGSITFQASSAAVLTVSSSGTTTFGNSTQTITLGGVYTTNSNGAGVHLRLNGNVTIPSTTTISADSKGYRGGAPATSGAGPGGGVFGSNNEGRGSGGGYGGTGGTGQWGNGSGGSTYGSSTAPIDLGSGGSGGGGTGDQSGGNGGGAIRLTTSGTLTVSGVITANGGAGGGGYCNGYPGAGGSGGSIYIAADTFTGAGTIRAKGGSGGTGCSSAGAGGGGRIAIYYITANNWSGTTLDATTSATAGTSGIAGSNGTVTVTANSTPSVSSLSQYASNCTTVITTGGTLEGAGAGSIGCFKGTLSDTDNPESLQIEVETKPIGVSFDGVGTSMSTVQAYSGTGVVASVTISGHTLGVNFHWRARAVDQRGFPSSWSSYGGNTESESDFLATIPPPTNVTVTYNSDTSLTISWTDNSTGEDGFIVERSTNDGAYANASGTLAANSTSFTDNASTHASDPPAANEKYIYRVYATVGGANSSTASSTASYTTPSAPSTASASQTGVGSITITWTDNAPYETYFEVQRQKDGGSFTTVTATVTADGTSYTDTTVHEAGVYVYKVRAIRISPDALQSTFSTASGVTLSSQGFGKGVYLTGDGRLMVQNDFDNSVNVWTKVDSDSAQQVGADVVYSATLPSSGPHLPTGATLTNLTVKEGASQADGRSDVIYVSTSNGMVAIHENPTSLSSGGIKHYTNSSITELLLGDSRGMWPLETVSDATNNSQTLTNTGTTSFTATGVRGKAATFNGSSQYLSLSDTATLSVTGNITIGGWFKTTSVSTSQTIVSKNGSYSLGLTSGGLLQAQMIGTTTATVTGQTILDTNWHHVVVVYNASSRTLLLYLDGQLDNSTTSNVPASLTDSSGAFQIGANNGGTLFSGNIDEVFIAATAYSAGHTRLLYQTGYKALQNHTANRVTGITADNYQKLLGGGSNGTTVASVYDTAVDEGNEFIFVGTHDTSGNTGGVTTIAVSSDSVVDLYDSTNNTDKKDDNNTQFSGNDIVAISVSGDPNPSYTPQGEEAGNGGMIVIAGTNDTATRVWMERQNYSLGNVLGVAAHGGSSGTTATITDLLRVGSLFTNASSTSGEQIMIPAFEVNQQGRITSNYLGIDDGATAFSFTDATSTTGKTLEITSNALTSGVGVNVVSAAASLSGTLVNITHTGSVNGTGYGQKIAMSGSGTTNVGLSVSVSGATNNYAAIFATGNVGVGTTSPLMKLHLTDSQAATASALFENTNTGASASVLALKLGKTSPSSTNSFATFLNGNGEVIGKITGNGSQGVSYSTSGSDFAEYFKKAKAEEIMTPGDTVCLSALGGVVKCTLLETNVIGVVSDRAGFVGGANRAGDSSYALIGLVGQLPVKVASDSALITIGDPLTLSSFSGQLTNAKKGDTVVAYSLQTKLPDNTEQTVLAYFSSFGTPSLAPILQTAYDSNNGLESKLTEMEVEKLTVTKELVTLGRLITTDLGVTGDITSGLLSIKGEKGEINVTGTLKLQPAGVGGVDILNGKVLVDTRGNIKSEGEVTAKKINIDTSDSDSAAAGAGSIGTGKNTVTIQTSAVTDDSLIYINFTSDYAPATRYWISAKEKKKSFTLTLNEKTTKQATFTWWIVN